jgi:hypothetical protein
MPKHKPKSQRFCDAYGNDDEGYLNALLRTFAEALEQVGALLENGRESFVTRLDAVCEVSRNFGYAIGDTIALLLIDFDD